MKRCGGKSKRRFGRTAEARKWNMRRASGSHQVLTNVIGMTTFFQRACFPRPPPAKWLHVAGGFTLGVWALLAWHSRATNGAALAGMLGATGAAWLALALAWRMAPSGASRTIGWWAVAFRVAAFFSAPVMEDDHHRFLWDGHRFAATGNPYAEAPQASFGDDTVPAEFRAVLDRINHPDVPTVYGPLTEWAFRLSHAIAPARLWPWKLILIGAEAIVLALLWPVLGARGRLLLAWCPLAIFETGFNAHPDALAIALVVAAWWLGQKSRPLAEIGRAHV